jgi:hypothetical protein
LRKRLPDNGRLAEQVEKVKRNHAKCPIVKPDPMLTLVSPPSVSCPKSCSLPAGCGRASEYWALSRKAAGSRWAIFDDSGVKDGGKDQG